MSRYLDMVDEPVHLKKLTVLQLQALAEEIRHELITVLSKNGGHLGPNLGVVELTLALHYVFNTPKDKFVWDVSHQCYVHKMLTERKDRFHTIRQTGGLNGFALRSESPHDCYGAGHAGTALSAALGMCAARDKMGTTETVVCIFGDAALTIGAHETGSAIEFHGHNDAGCAVANALTAQAAGATHLDATVLGIGERNGIASLEGIIAGLYVQDPATIRAKYDLPRISELARLVAARIGIEVPFNHCIVGRTAFTHKAGIHTKAIINDPHSYEVLEPEDFGLERAVLVAHRLAGHNAIGARARALGLSLSPGELRHATTIVKAMADDRKLTDGDVNDVLLAMAERRAAG